MISFLLRKYFYDLWDNLFRIILLNLGFLSIVLIPLFLGTRLPDTPPFQITASVLILLLAGFCLTLLSALVKNISDGKSAGFSDISFKRGEILPREILFTLFLALLPVFRYLVLPFYLRNPHPSAVLAGAFLFWITLFFILSFQFFLSLDDRVRGGIKKTLYNCLLLCFDNLPFALFTLLFQILLLLPSALFLLLFPGPAGILLFLDEAVRLRLRKYLWLETHPGGNRKRIPWEELLAEDREKTGKRSFRNFIFPWKD